ncbi:hypothetical protein FOZ60_016666 [Perkinsus olseni]|uniref:subtilisin n=1 Tax=Perkinsus olseni TaxID=32597 RepID=A0A7J6PLK2_PEROL|nr:hypothetical protein FOZ60_016666 [Perkinsus olseni]
MRIPSTILYSFPVVGATAPPDSTIVSIKSATGDVDVRQLPGMLTKAGHPFDPEVASFLETAEITTLEYVHSQVVQTPPHTIGSEALCSFVTSASSKLSLQSECAEDGSGVVFKLDSDLHVNDPDAGYQKHLKWMDMGEVWELALPHVSRLVKTAVLDAGIDWTDRDFAPLRGRVAKRSGGYLEGGWNFFSNSSGLTTGETHGTNVCKILAAKSNNSFGIAGIAPNVTLIPLQMIDDDTNLPLSKFLAAIDMAIDLEVDVMSVSLGYYFSGLNATKQHLLWNALHSAHQHGILVVSAAGNHDDEASDIYPCWFGGPLSICVANLDDHRPQNFLNAHSNYGERVDVAAYGTNIFTGRDEDGNLRYFSGTSASAPVVTGLVAILLSMGTDPMMVKGLLLANVDPMAPIHHGAIRGGAINALKTVEDAIRSRRLHGSDDFGLGN